jgi:hypothetical protein
MTRPMAMSLRVGKVRLEEGGDDRGGGGGGNPSGGASLGNRLACALMVLHART